MSKYANNDENLSRKRRRETGAFFTPLPYAELAHRYLEGALGPEWWLTHKVWDMAAGTGNLVYGLPDHRNVYLSTLEDADVAAMRELYPGAAEVFQYNYLQRDAEDVLAGRRASSLPDKLKADLDDPENKWLILMNPPYAEAGNGANGRGTKQVQAASRPFKATAWGQAGNELFMQFLYRLSLEIPRATIGMFSKLKPWCAPNSKKFRAAWYPGRKFEGGFIMPSTEFAGTKAAFPISFAIWTAA